MAALLSLQMAGCKNLHAQGGLVNGRSDERNVRARKELERIKAVEDANRQQRANARFNAEQAHRAGDAAASEAAITAAGDAAAAAAAQQAPPPPSPTLLRFRHAGLSVSAQKAVPKVQTDAFSEPARPPAPPPAPAR